MIAEVVAWEVAEEEYPAYCERYVFEGYSTLTYAEYCRSMHAAATEAEQKGIPIRFCKATVAEMDEALQILGLKWEPNSCAKGIVYIERMRRN